jgi:hypothetical protein
MNPHTARKINTLLSKKKRKKRLLSPKDNNDRRETHKMFILRGCFGFILLF